MPAPTPEYLRGVVEVGHIAAGVDTPWGKTTEDGLSFTPGSIQREYLYTGQDLGPVDSQTTRIEGTQVRFKMAQADPLTIARTMGLPDSAVTGVGAAASLKVTQADIGSREFELYAIVLGSAGPRRIKMPRAVVSAMGELNFTKGQWAAPESTLTLLQPLGGGSFWEFVPEPEPEA